MTERTKTYALKFETEELVSIYFDSDIRLPTEAFVYV